MYGGIDPITKQRIRFRGTVKTEVAAQIALGRLLEQALADAGGVQLLGERGELGAAAEPLMLVLTPPAARWR